MSDLIQNIENLLDQIDVDKEDLVEYLSSSSGTITTEYGVTEPLAALIDSALTHPSTAFAPRVLQFQNLPTLLALPQSEAIGYVATVGGYTSGYFVYRDGDYGTEVTGDVDWHGPDEDPSGETGAWEFVTYDSRQGVREIHNVDGNVLVKVTTDLGIADQEDEYLNGSAVAQANEGYRGYISLLSPDGTVEARLSTVGLEIFIGGEFRIGFSVRGNIALGELPDRDTQLTEGVGLYEDQGVVKYNPGLVYLEDCPYYMNFVEQHYQLNGSMVDLHDLLEIEDPGIRTVWDGRKEEFSLVGEGEFPIGSKGLQSSLGLTSLIDSTVPDLDKASWRKDAYFSYEEVPSVFGKGATAIEYTHLVSGSSSNGLANVFDTMLTGGGWYVLQYIIEEGTAEWADVIVRHDDGGSSGSTLTLRWKWTDDVLSEVTVDPQVQKISRFIDHFTSPRGNRAVRITVCFATDGTYPLERVVIYPIAATNNTGFVTGTIHHLQFFEGSRPSTPILQWDKAVPEAKNAFKLRSDPFFTDIYNHEEGSFLIEVETDTPVHGGVGADDNNIFFQIDDGTSTTNRFLLYDPNVKSEYVDADEWQFRVVVASSEATGDTQDTARSPSYTQPNVRHKAIALYTYSRTETVLYTLYHTDDAVVEEYAQSADTEFKLPETLSRAFIGSLGGNSAFFSTAFYKQFGYWPRVLTNTEAHAVLNNHVFDGDPIPATTDPTPDGYRLYITETRSTSVMTANIREIEFRATPGGPDITDGGTFIASSEYSGTYAASKAFDNNTGTYWSSAGAPAPFPDEWIGCLLASPQEAVEVMITSEGSFSRDKRAPEDFEVQKTTDGGDTWETVKVFTGEPAWAGVETRVYSLT